MLTYKVGRYPSKLSRAEVDADVGKAFKMWAKASGLTFVRKYSGNVDIEIRFESYEHGDGDPFDGPGGTLAHAYFPQYGGDIHMDSSERWTINTERGTNLLQTLTHEIGHSIGLAHSSVPQAVMFPFSGPYDPNFKLHTDDIGGEIIRNISFFMSQV